MSGICFRTWARIWIWYERISVYFSVLIFKKHKDSFHIMSLCCMQLSFCYLLLLASFCGFIVLSMKRFEGQAASRGLEYLDETNTEFRVDDATYSRHVFESFSHLGIKILFRDLCREMSCPTIPRYPKSTKIVTNHPQTSPGSKQHQRILSLPLVSPIFIPPTKGIPRWLWSHMIQPSPHS